MLGPRAARMLSSSAATSDTTCEKQVGSDFGQLALRRLLSAPEHASDCPEPRSMRRMGGSGRVGLIGPVLDTGATCDAATSSTWCGGATWFTSSSEPSASTLRTRYALAAHSLPARGRDIVEMRPGTESCRLPQSHTPWRSVTNVRMPRLPATHEEVIRSPIFLLTTYFKYHYQYHSRSSNQTNSASCSTYFKYHYQYHSRSSNQTNSASCC